MISPTVWSHSELLNAICLGFSVIKRLAEADARSPVRRESASFCAFSLAQLWRHFVDARGSTITGAFLRSNTMPHRMRQKDLTLVSVLFRNLNTKFSGWQGSISI